MSNIEWTGMTWNPIVGCNAISPGCKHCYAETMAKRLKAMALADITKGKNPGRKKHYIDAINERGKWSGLMVEVPESLNDPLRVRKPTFFFVNSMSDLFHASVRDTYLDKVFGVMGSCDDLSTGHTFQILTKRPERMMRYSRSDRAHLAWNNRRMATEAWPARNIWLGASAENQEAYGERRPHLERVNATVIWWSLEPLLGPINLNLADSKRKPDWVVIGGESGSHARPCDIGWIRSIVDQCKTASVPVFVKQLGAKPFEPARYHVVGDTGLYLNSRKGGDITEWPDDLKIRQYSEVSR